MSEAILSGGPLDGAKVKTGGPTIPLPEVIFVGAKWLGDGYAAWSRKRTYRFPCKYVADGDSFRYNLSPAS